MEIYLSLELETILLSSQRVIFAITSVLNIISMYCLLKKMPRNQAGVRNYLIVVQVVIVLISVYLDVLFEAVPLMPAPALYCVGVLCSAGVRPDTVLGLFIFLICLLGLSSIACVFYRHQSIIPVNNSLKMGKGRQLRLRIILAIITCTLVLSYPFYPFDTADTAKILAQSPYNLTWTLDRGTLLIHEKTTLILVAICLVELNLVLVSVLILFPFWHMQRVLSSETTRPPASIRRIRHSLTVLFIQIAVPFFTMIIPAAILFISLHCECIPFAFNMFAFCVLALHPLAHNLCLLSITPQFRRVLFSGFKGHINKTGPYTVYKS